MNDKPIVYEVSASVEAGLADAYELFIGEHVPDVLATGFFSDASFESSSPGHYRVRYVARDRLALERYLSECAPRLRADFHERFPAGVELTRAEWTVLRRFA